MLGSTDAVYPEGDVSMSCSGVISSGAFSNTEGAGNVNVKHDNAVHHAKQPATCSANGVKEYYECEVCKNNYSDEAMTDIITDLAIPATATHTFEGDVCKGCGLKCPLLNVGEQTVNIVAVGGDINDDPSNYNLFRFIPEKDGKMTVFTSGDVDIYGALWTDLSGDRVLLNDDGGKISNFR